MLIHPAVIDDGAAGQKIDAGPREFSPMLNKSPAITVLIVDDEPLIRWSLAETLTDRGYGVLEAADGHGAIETVSDASSPIEVIMLDYRLPDLTGLQVLARIRSLSPATRVVLMSAFGTPEVTAEAFRLGAVSVINKPIEMHEVADLVARARGAAPA